VVARLAALVPPRPSVPSPGAGNEPKKELEAGKERATKVEEGYGDRIVVFDGRLDAPAIASQRDRDGAAIEPIRTSQQRLRLSPHESGCRAA
jgi:hypothetical protein